MTSTPSRSRLAGALLGTAFTLGTLSLSACGNEDSPDAAASAARGDIAADDLDVSSGATSAGPLVLDARVTLWSESRLEVRYELANGDERPLLLFDARIDEAPPTNGLPVDVPEDGPPRLVAGRIDQSACLAAATPPLVGGRVISPGETLSGELSQPLPLRPLPCHGVAELDPASIELCVGHHDGPVDEVEAVAPGRYYRESDVERQRLVCVTLTR